MLLLFELLHSLYHQVGIMNAFTLLARPVWEQLV